MCPRHEEIVRGFSSGDQLSALSYSLADDLALVPNSIGCPSGSSDRSAAARALVRRFINDLFNVVFNLTICCFSYITQMG